MCAVRRGFETRMVKDSVSCGWGQRDKSQSFCLNEDGKGKFRWFILPCLFAPVTGTFLKVVSHISSHLSGCKPRCYGQRDCTTESDFFFLDKDLTKSGFKRNVNEILAGGKTLRKIRTESNTKRRNQFSCLN